MSSLIKCRHCGHMNLPNYSTCSKCGGGLAEGAPAAAAVGGSPDDDYQKLLRAREAAAKRTRMISGVVAVIAVGGIGFALWTDRAKKAGIQAKLDFVETWHELDKRETGAFWNCVTQSQTPVDNFVNADQVRMKVETAYATQPKNFGEIVRTECVAKLQRAEDAAKDMMNVPVEFKDALDKYNASMPKLQHGIEDYVDRLAQRGTSKDVDQMIQTTGDAWHSNNKPSPEGIAFDKFLHCAIPGLAKLKDAQALLEFIAEDCLKRDAVAFMDRIRKDCGPILTTIDLAAKAPPTFNATMKAFFEDERRMMSAWEDCTRKSRKGKKSGDLDQFLHATVDHLEARVMFGKIGREIQDSR